MFKRVGLTAATLTGCLLLAATSSAQNTDQVFSSRGVPTRGTISKISPTEVVIESSGVPRTFPVNEIVKVTFSDDPGDLRSARDRIQAGQLEDALSTLGTIDINTISRNVVKQDLVYYMAYCKAKVALANGTQPEKKDAASAMYTFLKRYGGEESFHRFEAYEILGDLGVAIGQYDTAVGFYEKVAEAPWPDFKLKAAVLSASALSQGGKFPEALSQYEKVIAAPVGGEGAARQKLLASVGKALCLAETGKADEGLTIVQDLIQKNDPQDIQLFSKAYNAMGACYRNKNQPQDALMAYLHTDLLFNREADAHAEALVHLTNLWTQVNKPERGREARQLLLQRYGGSPWASQVQ